MGSRGPLPESKSILAGRGSPLARGRDDDPPAPSPIRLEPPSWLQGEGRAIFESAESVLAERGVLSRGIRFHCVGMVLWPLSGFTTGHHRRHRDYRRQGPHAPRGASAIDARRSAVGR